MGHVNRATKVFTGNPEWMLAVLAVKRANGQRVGAVLYGFDVADDGSTLIENEAEQTTLAEIKTIRSRGLKLKQIAAALTEGGVPTKTGRAMWGHQAVARILGRVG